MATLKHAIKVAATRERTFSALTRIQEIQAWHVGLVSGEVSPGAVFNLDPRPGLRFGWRTETIEPDTRLVQTCTEGPGTSAGKTLTLTLGEEGDRTVLTLEHGPWDEAEAEMAFCNTYWGSALSNLRDYLEGEPV